LTEVVDLGGYRVTLVDTAGIVESDNPVEREGVQRARQSVTTADCVLLVCDGSSEWPDDLAHLAADCSRSLVVSSKSDLPAAWDREDAVRVSSLTGDGVDALVDRLQAVLGAEGTLRDVPQISNVRHIDLLLRAREALTHAAASIVSAGGALSEEFVLADLQQARHLLEEVTGTRTTDDVLVHVFERFCVGK
jgi:tRNA modification GTPase